MPFSSAMNKSLKRHSGKVFGSRLTATISISLVLLLFAVMISLGFFANDLSRTAKENISLTILLHDKVQANELSAMQKKLQQAEWAKSFQYISKETALEELTKELGENPATLLGYNPLPASFEVLMHSDHTQIDQIKRIVNVLSAHSYVQEVVYREDLIQLVNKNLLSIGKLLLGVALLLTLISFLLIRNTVRLMIYSKRFLIHTMCLVGAKRSFIRRPFVWQNARCGFISAVLAMLLFYGLLSGMNPIIPGIQSFFDNRLYAILFALLVGLGVVISVLATIFAVNRFLRMSSDELYYV